MKDNDNTATFPQKYKKQLPTGWDDIAQSMKDDELKKVIFECEGNIYTIEQSKDGDTKLQQAKEMVKEMQEPYTDAKKCQTAKIKFALYVLESRGVNLDKSDS